MGGGSFSLDTGDNLQLTTNNSQLGRSSFLEFRCDLLVVSCQLSVVSCRRQSFLDPLIESAGKIDDLIDAPRTENARGDARAGAARALQHDRFPARNLRGAFGE